MKIARESVIEQDDKRMNEMIAFAATLKA